MKKYLVLLFLLVPTVVSAAWWNPFTWFKSEVTLGGPSEIYQKTILPQTDSTYTLGASGREWLNVYTDELCLNGNCKTAWPTGGGGGGGAGTFATSTAWGSVLYNYPINSNDIVAVGYDGSGVATSTNEAEFVIDPTAKLASFLNSTKLGIGTSTPYAQLSVVGQIVGAYFTATTSTASTFPYASSTALSATTLCLTGDTCRTTWPAGSIDGTGSAGMMASWIDGNTLTATSTIVGSHFIGTSTNTSVFGGNIRTINGDIDLVTGARAIWYSDDTFSSELSSITSNGAGQISLYDDGGSNYATLDMNTLSGNDKVFTFPDASGTFCLVGTTCDGTASSTLLSDTNTWSALNTHTASTTMTSLRLGSTAIGNNVLKVGHLTGLTVSNSESVGGVFNMNTGTTDSIGMVLYNNHTGTNRLLSLRCDAATYAGNCLHVNSDGTESAFNILGAPVGKGVGKLNHQSTGDADASILSLDASAAGYLGQGIFLDCTGGSCAATNNAFSTSNEGGTNGKFVIKWGGNVGLSTSTPGTALSIGNTGNDTINITPTATSTFGSGINIRTGCFAVNGTCVGGGGAGTPGGSDTQLQFNDSSAFGGAVGLIWKKTMTRLGIGTTTPAIGKVVIATSTEPQITLTDGSLTSTQWSTRTINGVLYHSTTSPSTNATSTIPALQMNSTGYPSLSVGTTTSAGILNLGANPTAGAATSTIFMEKIQIQGKNSAGTLSCAYIAGTSWVVQAGACNN